MVEGMGTSNLRLIADIEEFLKNDPRIFENIWAVFDKDDVPESYFDNSIQSAIGKGWNVGWTNDSFELWYLLHFEYLQSAITRKQYKEKLKHYLQKEGLEGYEKNDPQVFNILYARRDRAIKNAYKLEKLFGGHLPPSKRNPCTNIHYLVEELVELEQRLKILRVQEKCSD